MANDRNGSKADQQHGFPRAKTEFVIVADPVAMLVAPTVAAQNRRVFRRSATRCGV